MIVNQKEHLVQFLNRQNEIIALRNGEVITENQMLTLQNGNILIQSKQYQSQLSSLSNRQLIVKQIGTNNVSLSINSKERTNIHLDDVGIKESLFIQSNLATQKVLEYQDAKLIGNGFFVEIIKEGRIFLDETIKQLDQHYRQQIYFEVINYLINLHQQKINFIDQQQYDYAEKIRFIYQEYKKSETKLQPKIEDLLYWFSLNIPKVQIQQTLCLGKVSIDNFLFHPTQIKIIGLINIEQLHIGNPIIDLCHFLQLYDIPFIENITPNGLQNIFVLLGLPNKNELINQYCQNKNSEILQLIDYYSILGLLESSIGFQKQLKNSSDNTIQTKIDIYSQQGWEIVQRITNGDPFQIKLISETEQYLWSKYPVSERCKSYYYRIRNFMRDEVYPIEKQQFDIIYGRHPQTHWQGLKGIEQLQQKAKSLGLWNLFINDPIYGKGLTQLEYAFISELMGMSFFGHEIFNCYAPETGNIKLLIMAGTPFQKQKYLQPLLEGQCKSFFAMSEKEVASSDPTNFQTTITKQGDGYIIKGKKWMVSGISDQRCKFGIIMGKTTIDPKSPFTEQSMVLVDYPNTNIKLGHQLQVLGYDEAPHGLVEVEFDNVYIPKENLLGKEGTAFAMSQGRLLGGRLHHSVRLLGLARRSIDVLLDRGQVRKHKGKFQKEDAAFQEKIGRIETDFLICRTLMLNAAMILDAVGGRHMSALKAVSETKAYVPYKCQCIIDECMQLFGAQGLTNDQILQICYSACRGLRLMDGPCELHLKQVSRFVLGEHLFNELVNVDGYIAKL